MVETSMEIIGDVSIPYGNPVVKLTTGNRCLLSLKMDGKITDQGKHWKGVLHNLENGHIDSTCGLMFSIPKVMFQNGKSDEIHINNLMYLVQHLWEPFLVFGRVMKKDLDRWCSDRRGYILCEDVGKACSIYPQDNMVNIEFFRATNSYSTFMATLEMVNLLINDIKPLGYMEIHDFRWTDLLKLARNSKYKYLYSYMTTLGLA